MSKKNTNLTYNVIYKNADFFHEIMWNEKYGNYLKTLGTSAEVSSAPVQIEEKSGDFGSRTIPTRHSSTGISA